MAGSPADPHLSGTTKASTEATVPRAVPANSGQEAHVGRRVGRCWPLGRGLVKSPKARPEARVEVVGRRTPAWPALSHVSTRILDISTSWGPQVRVPYRPLHKALSDTALGKAFCIYLRIPFTETIALFIRRLPY